MTNKQYDKLAANNPDKYWTRKEQNNSVQTIKAWRDKNDPRYQKWVQHMKANGASDEEIQTYLNTNFMD